MSCDKRIFREAMSLLGAAVNVITTNGPAGKCGYTGTAACSVTDEPAMLLVCLNRSSKMNKVFRENGNLCVNVLSGDQVDLSNRFAGIDQTPMEERFASADWVEMMTGAPANTAALCALDCKISFSHDCGTHSVFFCEVQDIQISGTDNGLIYWARQYHQLAIREKAA